MAVNGVRAQNLLSEVLYGVRPHLPGDIRFEVVRHKKWTTLRRLTGNAAGAVTVRIIGPPIPLPRRTSARLTAQDAVETVLSVAYWASGTPYKGAEQDFDVRAVVTGDAVSVSYRPPGADDLDARVELPPIPLRLL
jgi:hypothetical protein